MSNQLEIKSMFLSKFLEMVSKNTTDFYTKRKVDSDDSYFLYFYKDVTSSAQDKFKELINKAYYFVDYFMVDKDEEGKEIVHYLENDLKIFLTEMDNNLIPTTRKGFDFSNSGLILVFNNGLTIELTASDFGSLNFLN